MHILLIRIKGLLMLIEGLLMLIEGLLMQDKIGLIQLIVDYKI